MAQGPMPHPYLFDELTPRLKKTGIHLIDLQEDFSTVDDPSLLYFQQDAHWNATGIYRAARQIAGFIQKHDRDSGK
jgi:hypothetical protein